MKISDNESTLKSSNGSKILSKCNSIVDESEMNLNLSQVECNDELNTSNGHLHNIKIEKQINTLNNNNSNHEKVYTMNLNKFKNDKSYTVIHNKSKTMHESRDKKPIIDKESHSTLDKSLTESNIIKNFK